MDPVCGIGSSVCKNSSNRSGKVLCALESAYGHGGRDVRKLNLRSAVIIRTIVHCGLEKSKYEASGTTALTQVALNCTSAQLVGGAAPHVC